jgi:hypothetical protein
MLSFSGHIFVSGLVLHGIRHLRSGYEVQEMLSRSGTESREMVPNSAIGLNMSLCRAWALLSALSDKIPPPT